MPGAKEKAPYVPGSTHGAGIVPDDGGRPKWAQLWHRVYFLRPFRPMERPYIDHQRISRMNLSALCALLVRHSIFFCKVHYRSGLSLVAMFPVDGYILQRIHEKHLPSDVRFNRFSPSKLYTYVKFSDFLPLREKNAKKIRTAISHCTDYATDTPSLFAMLRSISLSAGFILRNMVSRTSSAGLVSSSGFFNRSRSEEHTSELQSRI